MAPVQRRPPSMTNAKFLRRVRYFGSLPTAELRRLAEKCTERSLGPGEMLFEESQPCHGLFLVAEGSVEVRQTSVRGRDHVFHTEGPGATLAEGPLFDRGGYIATAVATGPLPASGRSPQPLPSPPHRRAVDPRDTRATRTPLRRNRQQPRVSTGVRASGQVPKHARRVCRGPN